MDRETLNAIRDAVRDGCRIVARQLADAHPWGMGTAVERRCELEVRPNVATFAWDDSPIPVRFSYLDRAENGDAVRVRGKLSSYAQGNVTYVLEVDFL